MLHSTPNLSVGCANRNPGKHQSRCPHQLARALCDGHGGGRHRQRLHRGQRRPADDGERLPHQHQHDPVGDQRLRPHLRGDDRHRRSPCRHVRAPQRLLPRRDDLRLDVGARRRRPDRDLADRGAHADGDRRRPDVAGDPRDDLRDPPRREGGACRRDHHRRRRARQRGRPAAGRRPHRHPQLALDLLPQRPDRRFRRRGHLPAGPRQGAREQRAEDRLSGDHGALGRARLAADRPRPGRRLGLGRPAGSRAAGAGRWRRSPPSCRSSAGPASTR